MSKPFAGADSDAVVVRLCFTELILANVEADPVTGERVALELIDTALPAMWLKVNMIIAAQLQAAAIYVRGQGDAAAPASGALVVVAPAGRAKRRPVGHRIGNRMAIGVPFSLTSALLATEVDFTEHVPGALIFAPPTTSIDLSPFFIGVEPAALQLEINVPTHFDASRHDFKKTGRAVRPRLGGASWWWLSVGRLHTVQPPQISRNAGGMVR